MTKFTLQPYTTPASRYQCPRCNHRNKTFVRYLNTETGEQLADYVGRCGRENSCGYHFKPRQYFEREGRSIARSKSSLWRRKKSHRPSTMDHRPKDFQCINVDIVNRTIGRYWNNNLVQYLLGRFGVDATLKLLQLYRIGTAKHWPGATVFWQIDIEGQVRTGKIMLYDAATGKRTKKPFNHITWAHVLLMRSELSTRSAECQMRNEEIKETSAIGIPISDFKGTSAIGIPTSDFKINQCLFGEHLLKEFPMHPVAVVESEKTAMIAAAYNDSFIWLASGSIGNLNPQLCKILKGRRVTLYPDLGAYDKWLAKALVLQAKIPRTVFNVSNMLERHATDADRKKGLDIGDFL